MTEADPVLRAATPTDAPAIAALIRRSKAVAMPWLPVLHTPEEDLDWVRDVLLARQEVLVADAAGSIVAVLVMTPGWVEHLYVDPAHQRRGLGRTLLDEAKRRHPDGLDLWAFQRNTRARAFYENAGFVAVAMTDGDNEERQPDVRYRWSPSAED